MRERTVVILLALLIGGGVGAVAVLFMTRTAAGDGQKIEGQPLTYWVRCLESENDALRRKAVGVLPGFGADAIAALVPKLGSGRAQDAAVDVLAQLGAPAVKPLIRELSTGSTHARVGAIRALDQMGPTLAAPATTDVARLLGDDATGPLAAQFLTHVGPNPEAVGLALDVLENGTAARQVDALRVLARAGAGDTRVEPALRKRLGDLDPNVRVAAFEGVCGLSPASADLALVMIEGLTKSETRITARVGLSKLGVGAIEPLRSCATRPAADLRVEAVGLLAQNIPTDPRAAEALLEFVPDGNPIVASSAAASLVVMRERDLTFVKKQVASTQPKVRAWAVREMRKVQPPLLDDISPMLDDTDELVRNEAAEAIRGLWQADDPFILHAPEAKDVQERIRGIRLLPFFRDLKKYDMMIVAMEDPNAEVRLAATRALGRSITSARAVNRLVEALGSDPSADVRADAASSLTAARSMAGVVEALKRATQDPDSRVSTAAELALRPRNIER